MLQLDQHNNIISYLILIISLRLLMDKAAMSESTNGAGRLDDARVCQVCGEPIYSRARVHPDCAKSVDSSKPVQQAPQKVCASCGEKSHVRKQFCSNCGTMF